MKITSELRLVSQFHAYNCVPGGGGISSIDIPFQTAEAEFPDSDLDAVLITGDLQFYDRKDLPEDDRKLMGFVVAEEISALCEAGLLPKADRIGVVLVGDLYAEPCLLKRGGSGDVEQIWMEFADRFRWVTGVAGNHDLFEGKAEFPSSFRKISNIHPLHFGSQNLDGIRVAGVSGILGNPRKFWRYQDQEFHQGIRTLLASTVDILVLHQGPIGSKSGCVELGSSMNQSVTAKMLPNWSPSGIAIGLSLSMRQRVLSI